MARMPKPFYRPKRDLWYVQIGKKQICLGRGSNTEIQKRYLDEMAKADRHRDGSGSLDTVAELFEEFYKWSLRNLGESSSDWYYRFLKSFSESIGGNTPYIHVKKHHVTQWLEENKGWGQSSRRGAITAIKRAFNWCVEEQYIPMSPVAGIKRPKPQYRVVVLTPEQKAAIKSKAIGPSFKMFLTALEETGARPQEVRTVEARHVDLEKGTWTFPANEHKTGRRTGKPRVIYLNDSMVELTRKLVELWPKGPIFRNSRKKPWTGNAVRCRMRNLRDRCRKAGIDVSGGIAYAYRHTFATEALTSGKIHPEELRELMGHESMEMISKVYGHLDQNLKHMRDVANKLKST